MSSEQDTFADIRQDLDESDDWKDQVDFVDSQELPFYYGFVLLYIWLR